MTAVLVSGKESLIAEVRPVLRARGAAVTEVPDRDDIPAVCAAAGAQAFDSYLQLPANFEVRGATAVRRVHHFYAKGVLARFTALAAVLPSLIPGARLTFVLGQLPPEAATSNDRAARRALTQVLAQAALADMPDGRLIVRVLNAGTSAEEIGLVALGEHTANQELTDHLSQLSYADWRVELLGLASVET